MLHWEDLTPLSPYEKGAVRLRFLIYINWLMKAGLEDCIYASDLYPWLEHNHLA